MTSIILPAERKKGSETFIESICSLKKLKSNSHVRLFAIPWIVVYQAPPSRRFPRQEYWSGLPFPSPGDLPDPGIESSICFTIWATREDQLTITITGVNSSSDLPHLLISYIFFYLSWVRKIPWRRKWQPTPDLLPRKFHGWRRLVGYSPWYHRVGHDWAINLINLYLSSTV